ncbi:protein PTHB1-like isoform X2 [Macrosteles quadrilineatus]|uniref:protein PTHB1-like isoform X2 n=1 Tax=Macrosteles quadrilineatus TaxID=74068 RepID=UPI0023E0E0D0|nr:protein PTHB1-like isoform X2 [Macrosteles quadrilineatus]
MSLFKSRELWSTLCGKDEHYDNGCMVVTDILSQGFDCIIVGSHSGFLRIFQPQPDTEIDPQGYRATDLLLEMQLPSPILQVDFGKLVSGSQSFQIGVLHPLSVAVYSLVSISGSAKHGDQYHLVLAYEHQLSKSAFAFVVGNFGGVKGRDFICVQSLDGVLTFLEQETFSVSRNLPCFLLPSPFVYISSSDSFIIPNANWMLESYRYEVLADTNRKLLPWWSLNIGEPIVDMRVITVQSSKASIIVLGERNLFFVKEGGSLELVKRLQFTPCCVHPYITEPGLNVMVLVVADTATLLVYNSVSLCWSSQLPFTPVSISRINLKCAQGLVALLAEEGQLVCCYLGTEPAVFIAPPLTNKTVTYDELQHRLYTLQQEIDSTSQTALQVSEGHELKVTTRTLGMSDPTECQLVVVLNPSAALSNAQVSITVTSPLIAQPATHHLPSICSEVEIVSLVSFSSSHPVPLLSVDAHIVIVYQGAGGKPHILQKTAVLPTIMVMQAVSPGKEGDHKIILSLSQPAVPLNLLFVELAASEGWENAGCTDSVAGLSHTLAPH